MAPKKAPSVKKTASGKVEKKAAPAAKVSEGLMPVWAVQLALPVQRSAPLRHRSALPTRSLTNPQAAAPAVDETAFDVIIEACTS